MKLLKKSMYLTQIFLTTAVTQTPFQVLLWRPYIFTILAQWSSKIIELEEKIVQNLYFLL